jgi:hypothetical protein
VANNYVAVEEEFCITRLENISEMLLDLGWQGVSGGRGE